MDREREKSRGLGVCLAFLQPRLAALVPHTLRSKRVLRKASLFPGSLVPFGDCSFCFILLLLASNFLFAVSLRSLFFLGVSWWRDERESKVHSFHRTIGSCRFSYYNFETCPILLLKKGRGGRGQRKRKSVLCVCCRERNETSLRGRCDYPKDLIVGLSVVTKGPLHRRNKQPEPGERK